MSRNLKVVADYSSEDEEREIIAQKMRSNIPIYHHKDQERYKKSKMNDPRDKKSSHRWTRTEESSSGESTSRRYSKGSRQHRVSVDREEDTLYNRTEVLLEKYSDDSDYDERYNKRETQKNRYQNKDKVSDYDRRDERRFVQKRTHRYDHSNSDSNRREMERNKHRYNDDSDRRKQEKSRHNWEDSDSDDYHKRDIIRFEEYADDQSDRKNNRREEDRTETLRNRYQQYENDHERRNKRQTQKSQHQQDDNDVRNRRSGRQDTQSEDSNDYDRRDVRYMQETGYQSDSDESDYDKRDERRQHADKSSNELEDDGSNNNRRKDKQHARKDRDRSSGDDSSEHDKQNNKRPAKKIRYQQDDGNNRNRRNEKRSIQKSSKYRYDSDDHSKTNEKKQLEKNKQQNDDNGAGTDYSRKGLQEGSHQPNSKNHHDRGQIEKPGFQNDSNGSYNRSVQNDRSYNRKKDNRKAVQESKNRDDSDSSDMDRAKDGSKSREDRCRWDSDEDERYDRRKLQKKYQQNSDSEYDRRENVGKYSSTDRSNLQKNFNRDLREDNRREHRKNDYREKERSSEIQLREELARNKDGRDHSRKEKQNESELQNRTREENENMKSNTKDVVDGIRKKQSADDILTRTGGAYIPPARLRAMQAKITDKSSVSYQRIAWEALKKSINGLINKVNVSNLKIIINELFKENVVRAKGILARSIMQAQAASPTFTHVYAALVAVINTKFPHIGELIIKRLIIQFRRSFRRNDKQVCLACTNFIAHLVNQQAAHEVLALEILTLLLENPTDDSVELAVGFLKECGSRLSDATRRGTDAIFERLRAILHDGGVDKRVQYMIEVMFAVRKDKFKDHPTVIQDLDLVEEEDQYTHLLTLEDAVNPEDILNVFRFDAEFEANEAKYEEIRKALLESSDSGEDNSDDDSDNDNEEDEDNENETQTIVDNTETNLISLRRTIYLTIQSSLDFEECAHKLLKLELKPGQIVELCYMILDCCAQQRTYEKFFGLLAQRFCQLNKIYVEPFEDIFKTAYDTIHRFETNKLRNVARFFAHLFYTDAVSWQILSHIKLNEDDTTSSSRIFVKILFQELCEYMGLLKLNERVKDPTMQEAFEGLFPRDSPRNTRFAINFFTSIGLGGLTDELREHLKNTPKTPAFPAAASLTASVNNDDNPDLSSEEARSNVEDSPSIVVSSSEEEPRNKKSRRAKKKKKRKNQDKQSKKKKKK